MEKNYILHKWLNNETLSDTEMKQLMASKEYTSYIKIAEATSGLTTPTFNKEGNKTAILEKLNAPSKSKIIKLNPVTTLLKIAAVVALVFIGYNYVNSLDTTIDTAVAQNKTVELPDASKVVINADSKLSYNKKNWDTKRELSLQGEAYFEVTKGKKFKVKTQLGDVQVLGTHFNVYAREKNFNVTCYEGLVSVTLPDTIIKVPAGHSLTSLNGNLISYKETPSKNPLWVIQKESSFENAPLKDVIKEIERQYPVRVTATPKSLLEKHFTGSFTHKNVEVALQTICKPLGLTFTIKGDEVSIYAK